MTFTLDSSVEEFIGKARFRLSEEPHLSHQTKLMAVGAMLSRDTIAKIGPELLFASRPEHIYSLPEAEIGSPAPQSNL